MKIYISGKITGDRRYKAKFREAEKKRTFVVGRNLGGVKHWVTTYAIESCPNFK